MKTLYIIRHAKSSWSDPSLNDFDRPLNQRGKRDAPFMAKLLGEQGLTPDIIISSPANRAITTAREMAKGTGYPVENIVENPKLYHASANNILEVVQDIDDAHNIAFVVGHNPGMTYLANDLTDIYIDNIPTTGICAVKFEVNSWANAEPVSASLISFDYPKNHSRKKRS